MRSWLFAAAAAVTPFLAPAAFAADAEMVAAKAAAVEPKVIAWRRDIHQNPELGNAEVRTAKLVAKELKRLGLEVRTGVGKTGVVGVLKGGKPGDVVALRADMDALPVEEKTGLPFASKAKGTYEGQTVPVMHACGHDSHVAMLLGAAEALASMRADIPGTVVFLFQPAEEGPPPGEEGGAALMLKEGAFDGPTPSAVFGLHVTPGDSGVLYSRSGPFFAASDKITIELAGRQTHGARPWSGVDITALTAEVITAVNQIAARQLDVSSSPTVITIATLHGGVRHNIIPEEMTLTGTLRTFTKERREEVIEKMTKRVTAIAESYGAKADVTVGDSYPMTRNDPGLTAFALPSLEKAAGGPDKLVTDADLVMGAEDFSHFANRVPGVYIQLGARPPNVDPETAPVNHSPFFTIDEAAMKTGVRAHVQFALDYLESKQPGAS